MTRASNGHLALIMALLLASAMKADDWPMAGRDWSRNSLSPEKTPPTDWQAEARDSKTARLVKPARNIKWSAALGSRTIGGPVVADGFVWVGTNNDNPRDPKRKGDASVLMCFRESDGKFLWQYVSPRSTRGRHEDWPKHSMGTPLVDGDRLWLNTNRCEPLCLDIGPLKKGTGEPGVVWKVDMRKDQGVFPNSAGMADGFGPSPALYKDWIYVVTSNGVDEEHVNVPAPEAPSLVCFEKAPEKCSGRTILPERTYLIASDQHLW